MRNGINIAGGNHGNKETSKRKPKGSLHKQIWKSRKVHLMKNTKIDTVRNDPVFEDYGRLLLSDGRLVWTEIRWEI